MPIFTKDDLREAHKVYSQLLTHAPETLRDLEVRSVRGESAGRIREAYLNDPSLATIDPLVIYWVAVHIQYAEVLDEVV